MTCPVCGGAVHVTDTWQFDVETTLRQRHCRECGHMFYTKEEECEANYWGEGWRTRPPAEKAKAGRKPTWDIEAGKKLWDDGASVREIANAMGVPYNVVYSYAYNYWMGVRR